MSPVILRQLAIVIARMATGILPPAMRQWGTAMRYEVELIERGDKAILFAIGCLGFALQQSFTFHVLRPFWSMASALFPTSQEAIEMSMMDALFQNPRRLTALCAIMATGLGLIYMGVAGAPNSYLAMNSAALAAGFVIVGIVAFCGKFVPLKAGAVNLTLAAVLLFTSLFGTSAGGATRWIALSSLFVQTSLLILPVLALSFARARDVLSTAAIVAASLALAIQPDRAMSGALAAGMVALVLFTPERNVMIAAGASLAGFLVAMAQADVQPAMLFVDQIFYSSFDQGAFAGLAVLGGAALMIVPAIAGSFQKSDLREAFAVFGAVWFTIILAAALGNYPTPLVGYGGSAIIGYVISLLELPKRTQEIGLDRSISGERTDLAEPHHHRFALN